VCIYVILGCCGGISLNLVITVFGLVTDKCRYRETSKEVQTILEKREVKKNEEE
jgi:hypothetical protein